MVCYPSYDGHMVVAAAAATTTTATITTTTTATTTTTNNNNNNNNNNGISCSVNNYKETDIHLYLFRTCNICLDFV